VKAWLTGVATAALVAVGAIAVNTSSDYRVHGKAELVFMVIGFAVGLFVGLMEGRWGWFGETSEAPRTDDETV